MNLNISREWLLRMAEKEGNGIISVGGLVCQILKGERESMATDPTHPHVITTAALPREGEGRESRASVVRRYQNALNEQGERLVEIHRKLSDREVELITLRAELAKRDEELAKAPVVDAALRAETQRRMVTIGELRDSLAKRDAEIVVRKRDRDHLKAETTNLEAKARNLQANLDGAHRELAETKQRLTGAVDAMMVERRLVEQRDETITKLSEANGRQCDTIMEQTRTITSLRTQLARAGAIEEATRALRAHLRPRGGQRWAADAEAALSRVDAALVTPSPRDTAEGERRKPENNVGCPSRIPVEAWGQEPCADCATSFWYPNPDCQRCIDRAKACGQIGDASMVERFASSPTPPLLRLLGAVGSALADHRSGHGIGRVAEELREAAEGCRGEGVRIAILERVAKEARSAAAWVSEGRFPALRAALADLDKLEATL